MPGEFHEILVKLIQDEPESVAWMLGLAGGRSDARCVTAESRSGAVGSPGLTERRADGVVRLRFDDDTEQIVICEVQNAWSEDKYFRLPGYMARAFEDYRVPVVLLMLCPSDSLAKRFGRGVEVGPGSTMAVAVVGPADMPDLTPGANVPTAAAAVAAAVMSREPKGVPNDLFVSTLDAWLGTLEPGRAADYAMYLLTTLAKEPAILLEALMKTDARLYHSEYTEQLLAKGRELGIDEGALRHSRAILLRVLEAEGPVSDERREQIESCSDLTRLDAWITEHIRTAKG